MHNLIERDRRGEMSEPSNLDKQVNILTLLFCTRTDVRDFCPRWGESVKVCKRVEIWVCRWWKTDQSELSKKNQTLCCSSTGKICISMFGSPSLVNNSLVLCLWYYNYKAPRKNQSIDESIDGIVLLSEFNQGIVCYLASQPLGAYLKTY